MASVWRYQGSTLQPYQPAAETPAGAELIAALPWRRHRQLRHAAESRHDATK